MKKLLSLLTISTLTASVPAPLLANTVPTRVKRDVGTNAKDVTNNYWTFIANISKEDAIKNKDKYYFVIYKNKGESNWQIYKMQMGKPNDKPIFDINIVESHKAFYRWDGVGEPNLPEINSSTGEIIDWNGFDVKIKEKLNKWEKMENDKIFNTVDNKWYIVAWRSMGWNITKFKNDKVLDRWTNKNVELDSKNEDENYKLTLEWYQKNGIINTLFIRSYSVVTDWPAPRFKAVYRWDGVGEPQTPTIDSDGNITDWKQPTKNDFQQGISFSLADGSETATWSNDGMRLTVDGETNINIDNLNITEVLWNGVKQKMLDHKVNINAKPETSEKTHKLVIKYDINGTKYTSEDIDVVMAAKIEPPKPIVKENLNDVIKFDNNNDLGNILDNNDDTIKAAITNKNSRSIDFSQIEIINKTDTQATLSAKPDSKSYKGSVVVKYNVVPATTVDLKIDLTSSASGVQIDKDYLAQLDKSKMTNKVDTFYYANGKSVIKIKQPSTGNVIIGKVYGCDELWNKTSQPNTIDPTIGLEIDKGQYGSVDGRYLIELQHKDLSTHTKTIYLQISEKQKVEHYWDTPNGKNFEQWAEDNGEKNIRGSSASQLNNLFDISKTWKQSLAHLDLKLDNFVVDNIQNVTQDEIDAYKTKLLASVKSQVEKYVPDVVENVDYVISVDNLVAGDWTTSKDVKVQAVDGSTKLLSFAIKTIPVQQKDQPTPPTPSPSTDKTKSFWKIVGIVAGCAVGVGIVWMLLWRYWLRPWRTKIRNARSDKRVAARRAQWAKEEAEAKAKAEQESGGKTDDGDNS